eukprot:scaffold19914_cov73-Cylindrotheca_fusiformis.AAC.1
MDDFGDLAGNAIDNHDRHMSQIDEQLGTAIDNHNRHMNNFGELAENAIENHHRHMYQDNEQLGTANENIEEGIDQGIRAFDEQANYLNSTAEVTAQEIGRAAVIGWLQVVAGQNDFSQIFRNLDDVARHIPQSIQELKEPNTILTNIADAHHEQVAIPPFVHSLTGPDENNPDYFAYDSIRDLLSGVFCWNAYLDFLENRNENLVRFRSRRTIVYFLDPPPINIVLSK